MSYHPERKDAPSCVMLMRHRWVNSLGVYGESGICTRCGWDSYDKYHRKSILKGVSE